MRGIWAALVAVLLLAALAGCGERRPAAPAPTDAPPTTAARRPIETASPTAPTPTASQTLGPARFDVDRAMEHLRYLSVDVGARAAGGEGERRTAEYLRSELERYGYTAELRPFLVEDNALRAAQVRRGGVSFDAFPLGGSASGEVRGIAMFVGLGRSVDVAGVDLRGRIAIADRGEVPFASKYANVRAAGAVALVVVNSSPGTFLGTLQQEATIPVVAVGQESRTALLDAAANGDELTVTVGPPGSLESVNVFATADPGVGCRVLVGGHHDSVPGTPGANDNASGVATVLELARAMAADGLDPGLCFATFGAEEYGLHGSRAMVRELRARGALPSVMVNLDVTGVGRQVEVIGSDSLVLGTLAIAAELGIAAVPSSLPPNASSDHASFATAGVPVLFLTSGDFSAIHTPEDRFEAIDRSSIERVGRVGHAALIALLGELPPFAEGT